VVAAQPLALLIDVAASVSGEAGAAEVRAVVPAIARAAFAHGAGLGRVAVVLVGGDNGNADCITRFPPKVPCVGVVVGTDWDMIPVTAVGVSGGVTGVNAFGSAAADGPPPTGFGKVAASEDEGGR
jgi:hypothetical protein